MSLLKLRSGPHLLFESSIEREKITAECVQIGNLPEYPHDLEMQDSACREVTEFKVVNCSCINNRDKKRKGLKPLPFFYFCIYY